MYNNMNYDVQDIQQLNEYIHTGKLVLAEKLNEIDFGVYNSNKGTFSSISDFLNKVYQSDSPVINLYMKNLDENQLYSQIGELHRGIDSDNLEDWFLEDFCLGKLLFEWGEQRVHINAKQIHLDQLEEESDGKI